MNLHVILNRFFIFLPLLLLTINNTAVSQTPTDQDCLGAIVVCDPLYSQSNSYSGTGNYQNEINSSISCLNSGEKNDVWYILTVQSDGDLGFLLTPNDDSDDYDWAVYNLTVAGCEDIFSDASLEVSCNYSGTTGNTGPNGGSGAPFNAMIPVQEGQTYVVNISNYSSTQFGYTLDFGISTAQIYDNVRPTISQVYGDDITCGDNTIDFLFSENVMCASVSTSSFTLTGPGGPFTITNVYGEACDVGGEMEKEYTLTVDPAFSVNGSYSLNIVQSGIYDACGNIALPDQFPFVVDLGAPEIDESNLTISNSTCGQNNGEITGLAVSGTPPFTYEWTDAGSSIVGTDLDLINVSAGIYTLTIGDPNTCVSIGGPYQINDEGAPEIDESNLTIGNSTCGQNNGEITGLAVSGNPPFTYEWTDAGSSIVGTDLDLTNVSAGIYTLTIGDPNTCVSIGGPYQINDEGAPEIDESNLTIGNSTCGLSNGSITNLTVTGTPPYTYEWKDVNSNIVGTDLDLLNVSAGLYTLTVKDENTCVSIGGPYQINDEGAPEIDESNLTIGNSICGQNNGEITGLAVSGTPPFTYEWTDAGSSIVGTDLDLINVSAGIYTLTIGDPNTCESIGGPYQINDEGAPLIDESNLTIGNSTCGLSNGSIINLTVTGTPPYTYEWKDVNSNIVGTDLDLLNVSAGLYTLTVKDENTCESIGGPYQINDEGAPLIDESNLTIGNSTCGLSNGSIINLTVTGTPPYTYEWKDVNSNIVGTDLDLLNVSAGLYTLTVKDENTCESIGGPYQIIDEGAPLIDESNLTIGNSTCGLSNGSITNLTVTGTPPYTYEWTDAGSNIVGIDLNLLNVPSGIYTLTVKDENTCESFGGPYQINDEGAPLIDISNILLTDNYCGATDGSITGIQVTGSTSLSYEWIDGNSNVVGTDLDLTNIIGGSYILKVTDENFCEAFSDPYIIEDKSGPVIDETIMVISNASCNENTGSIKDILVSGNQLTFEWTDEYSNVMGNSVDLLDVGPGNYSLKTNNVNNCEVVLGPYEVINIGGVALDNVITQNPTCELNNGSIEITATGGYGNRWYSIDVDTLWTDNGLFENLSPGTYNVLVKDDYDCILSSTNNPIILANMGAAIIANATADSPFCTENDLELICDFSGADIYSWQGPNGYTSDEQNPVISNAALTDAGTYTLIATTTPYNCSDTSEVEVEVLQRHNLDVSISVSKNPVSPGETIKFTASAPEASNDALYTWTVENDVWQEDYDSTFISNEIYNTSYVNCFVTSTAPCIFPNPGQSADLLLKVLQARVFLPNSFNPNSIYGNEIFKVKTLTANLIDFQMYIYTKWGQKIFTTTDNNLGWDGTINGELAPVGVYIWVVKYSDFDESDEAGTAVIKKGTVTLVR